MRNIRSRSLVLKLIAVRLGVLSVPKMQILEICDNIIIILIYIYDS